MVTACSRPQVGASTEFGLQVGSAILDLNLRMEKANQRLKMSKYAFLRSNASLIIVGLLLGLIGGFKIANSQYRRDQGKALKRDIAQATSRMPGSQASQ